jgi:hypothetical protein
LFVVFEYVCGKQIKGNKVRRPLLPSEEPNFYAPQWENYFGSTPPESNKNNNKPGCWSSTIIGGQPSTTTSVATTAKVPKQRLIKKIGNKILVDILPAPVSSVVSTPVAPKAAAVVSNRVHRSPSPPNNMDLPCTSTAYCSSSSSSSSSFTTNLQAATTAAQASWDEYVEESLFASDGDLLFFEGSPFHFLDDSGLPTTTSIVPQVCESGCHFMGDSSSSSGVVQMMMHPNHPSSLFAA